MATLILPLIRARDIVSASSKMYHWVGAIPISLGFESERIPIRDTMHVTGGQPPCVMVENTSKPDPIMHFYPRDSRRVSGIVVTCILFQVLF